MKKLLQAFSVVLALGTWSIDLPASVDAGMPVVAMVEAGTKCELTTANTNCDTVVDQSYGGGGVRVETVPLTACLGRAIFESIKLKDGRSAWEAGFYYGKGMPEVVVTVKNSQCWTLSRKGKRQTGVPGAYAIAYIDCDYYTGWVAGIIGRDGRANLEPIQLPASHDPCLKGGCGRS